VPFLLYIIPLENILPVVLNLFIKKQKTRKQVFITLGKKFLKLFSKNGSAEKNPPSFSIE